MKYSFLILLLFFSFCSKENSCDTCGKLNKQLDATIIDAGLVTADGCGWVLRVGASDLHPNNLPDSLKVSQLPVIVSFKITEKEFSCGSLSLGGLPIVEIISIRKK